MPKGEKTEEDWLSLVCTAYFLINKLHAEAQIFSCLLGICYGGKILSMSSLFLSFNFYRCNEIEYIAA